MKRANGAFRALVEAGASYTGGECLNAGRSRRPTCKLNGVDMNASRAVWWLAHGDPGSLKVLHSCGNDQCLNVRHLYLGTTSDNATDTVLMGRASNQVVNWATAREIARRYQSGKAGNGNGNGPELAAEYGVSSAVIRRAAKRVQRLASTNGVTPA